jgi:hypothetical protein
MASLIAFRQLSGKRIEIDFTGFGLDLRVLGIGHKVSKVNTKVNTSEPTEVAFEVDMLPPSVNHYKEPITLRLRGGVTRKSFKLTDAALTFRDLVWVTIRGKSIIPPTEAERKRVRYGLYVRVSLPKGYQGDGDNLWKCIADSLQYAKVIHNDNRVKVWYMVVLENSPEPKTEVIVKIETEEPQWLS